MLYKEFYNSIGLQEYQPLTKNQRVKFNRFVFKNIFKPAIDNCKVIIELTELELAFIENFIKDKVVVKQQESNGFDNKHRLKRELTGACIEFALLKYFKKQTEFDDSIVKSSKKKNYPDLLPLGILCDVKGSIINNVPLVFKDKRSYTYQDGKNKGKQYKCCNLIGITNHKTVWILGIATPEILKEYVDDNLIMFSENTSKTGFYGVNQLIQLPKKWNDFKKICKLNNFELT